MKKMNQPIDKMINFKIQESFMLGIFNGSINISELILSGKIQMILKDDKKKTVRIFNVPIEKKLSQTDDAIEILCIGGTFKHTFQKKTKMKEIHVKLGKHLVSIGDYGLSCLKGNKFILEIEHKHPFLRLG